MRKIIRESVASGFARTASARDSKFRTTSTPSGKPSSDSKVQWRQPANVKEFAAQANRVATMILEGTIELETARVYSSVARTVSQSMSIEVQRARASKEKPDLDFGKGGE